MRGKGALWTALFLLVVSATGCGSAVVAAVLLLRPKNRSNPAATVQQTPPTLYILSASQAQQGANFGDVTLTYILVDQNSDQVSITVQFSTDDGATWNPATESSSSFSHGTQGLSSSPGGELHIFVWDSDATDDLPGYVGNVRIRMVPTDDDGDGSPAEVEISLDNNYPPSVDVTTPTSPASGAVYLDFTLSDVENDECSITVEYSTDGQNWFLATEGTGSCGTTGLTPGSYTYVWDSLSDLGFADYQQVYLRITPADTKPGNAGTTGSFALNNNQAPSVQIVTPSGEQSGDITINYTIYDSNSDLVNIEVEWYDPDSGQWFSATEGSGSQGTTNLSSSPQGASHYFVWDSAADFAGKYSSAIRIRIKPTESLSGLQGSWAESNNFTVANNAAPSVTISTPPSPQLGDVTLTYTLTDQEGDTCSITVEYSTDGGAVWNAATEVGGDGTTNLTSSSTGVTHTFIWGAQTDLAGQLVSGVLVRIVPNDGYRDGTPGITAPFDVDATTPPSVQNISVPTSTASGNISIEYTLVDDESQNCSIYVEYSTDSGQTWKAATPGTGGDGTTNLSSSPAGVTHSFVWDSNADGVGATGTETVILRITPTDTKTGNSTLSSSFDVDNATGIPSVSVQTPSGEQSGDITITYTLFDPDNDPCSIEVEYWDPTTGTWKSATMGPGGDGTTNLSASPSGVDHTYVWASGTDLFGIYTQQARVRIRPDDGTYLGSWVSTGYFTVANNNAPSVVVTTPSGTQSGGVLIQYTLYDDESDPCSIVVEYTTDGTNWYHATELTSDPQSEGTTNLSSSPSGSGHSFVWDSMTDVGAAAVSVKIRIVPNDGNRDGAPGETNYFDVVNVIDITWTGSVNNDWDEAGNWSGGTPSTNANVTIPANCPNYPVLRHDETINDLNIENGASLTIKGDFQLRINGNATISGDLIADSSWANVVIDVVGDLTVNSGGRIDASGKGYPSGMGLGAGKPGGSGDGGGGGSHGGYGGYGDSWVAPGPVYDSALKPVLPGSGGGVGDGGVAAGGSGGGAVKIIVGGVFTLEGDVLANGADGVDGGGGGAGGSIWIDCDSLIGGGVIEANGGDAIGGASLRGGGGGGGRIAVYYNDISNFTNISGCSASVGSGANTSRYHYGSILFICKNDTSTPTDDDLYIHHDTHIIDTLLRFRNVTIDDNVTVALNSYGADPINCPQITISASGDMIIGSGAVITAEGLGYRPSEGPGAGEDNPPGLGTGAHGGGHGGFGGRGDNHESADPGKPYDDIFKPTRSGSGGGLGDNGWWGGVGGGAIRINVKGRLALNGEINADGMDAPGWDPDSGGGAGGSIWITCTELVGGGFCTARGGGGSDDGGGGSGGIIVVYFQDDSNFTGHTNFSVDGGPKGSGVDQTPYGDGSCGSCLFINTQGTSSVDDDVVHIYTASRVSQSFTCGALKLYEDASLFIDSYAAGIKSGGTDPVQVTITVNGNMEVETNAGIYGIGLGWKWGSGPAPGEDSGDGAGGGGNAGAGGDGGGGAGGSGGQSDPNGPTTCGSGGGSRDPNNDSRWGARGGAALKLVVSGTLTLNGEINMGGETAVHLRCGGGAGGSVWIVCGVLTGGGEIGADGGNGRGSGGGGGGGYIKVQANDATGWSGSTHASGGTGQNSGEDGSIVGP